MGLDPSLFCRLMEIIKPHAPHNPWQRANRIRNYAILLILCCLGLRLGEVLALRLNDVATRGGTGHLDIRRRPPDPRDLRRRPPKPKTLGRRLPLIPALSRAIDAYILGPRLATSGGRSSEYLFLGKGGSNFSPRAAQQMVQQLVAHHPEFAGLCAHQLRNTNSDHIQQALRDSSLNDHQARDVHTYMGGWVPGSVQPARYSKRWLTAQAESISLTAQKDVLGD
jgi:integrase